jgi:hypothetical protein
MLAQLAALQGHVAQLEVELSTMPSAEPRAPARRLRQAFVAMKLERDELAVQLAQVEAYQPGIAAKVWAWIAQVDGTAGAADIGSKRHLRNRWAESRHLKKK